MILLSPEENPYEVEIRGIIQRGGHRGSIETESLERKAKVFRDGAKTQLKQVVEWGDGECEHYPPNPNSKLFRKGMKRIDCPKCWQALKKEVE